MPGGKAVSLASCTRCAFTGRASVRGACEERAGGVRAACPPSAGVSARRCSRRQVRAETHCGCWPPTARHTFGSCCRSTEPPPCTSHTAAVSWRAAVTAASSPPPRPRFDLPPPAPRGAPPPRTGAPGFGTGPCPNLQPAPPPAAAQRPWRRRLPAQRAQAGQDAHQPASGGGGAASRRPAHARAPA